MSEPIAAKDVAAGAAVYNPVTLRAYDLFVHTLTGHVVWRCPGTRLQALYDEHAGARHLDIGVGTGILLDGCRWPVERPAITLADLNEHALAHAARRIARYAPACVTGDVLAGLDLPARSFDSIGLSYLLHCIPGSFDGAKGEALASLAPLLAPGGRLFGATVCASGVDHTPLSRAFVRLYNARGIFHCRTDTRDGLETALRAAFADVEVRVCGAVALFVARI